MNGPVCPSVYLSICLSVRLSICRTEVINIDINDVLQNVKVRGQRSSCVQASDLVAGADLRWWSMSQIRLWEIWQR